MNARNYYQEKTLQLLEKYGPGPRVHYHLGCYPAGIKASEDRCLVQRQIIQGQEDMMLLASEFWGQGSLQGRRLLDVGAGLGGASLWMASLRGALVDALVQCEEHARCIKEFAALCGLSEKVSVFVGDAHALPFEYWGKYDVIYAMESPCYFDRFRWFSHLGELLHAEGEVWIEDVFWGEGASSGMKKRFDDYWKTDIGTFASYQKAASYAGFALQSLDITEETTPFWRLSAAWSRLGRLEEIEEEKRTSLERSIQFAAFHLKAWQERQFEMKLLRLRRKQSTKKL